MTGLQSLGVSQCSGVTGEGLLQLLPSWPALTRLSYNCLHLTADHVDTLIKVWCLATMLCPMPYSPALLWLDCSSNAWHVSVGGPDISPLMVCRFMSHVTGGQGFAATKLVLLSVTPHVLAECFVL